MASPDYWSGGRIKELEAENKLLREALEEEWRMAHLEYCGCEPGGKFECYHRRPEALATIAQESK